MARAQDPTRLSDNEARAFRTLVHKIKTHNEITTTQLAEYLGVSDRHVSNLLSKAGTIGKQRGLLAGKALALLDAIASIIPEASDSHGRIRSYRHRAKWLAEFESRSLAVAALIPIDQIDRFATVVANGLPREPGISIKKRDAIRKGIAHVLRRERSRMSIIWANSTANQVAMYVQRAEAGRELWRPNGDLYVDDIEPRTFPRDTMDVLEGPASRIAAEAIHLAVTFSEKPCRRQYDDSLHKPDFAVHLPLDVYEVLKKDPDSVTKVLKEVAQKAIATEIASYDDPVS